MYRKQLLAIVVLAALCSALLLRPAHASVGLVDFTAQPTGSGTIMLAWETATEDGTTGYKLYRSVTGSDNDWIDLIPEGVPAEGTAQGGAQYSHEDANEIVPGVLYYYQLREVTTGGDEVVLDTVTAGVNLPAQTTTGTPTATPTRRPTNTATNPRQPTATRRFTDGPPTAAPTTPSPQGAATALPTTRNAAATPLPGASVATPTGPAPRLTLPAAPLPSVAPATDVVSPLVSPEPASPTPALVALGDGTPVETPTPRPTRDVTPIIFSSAAEGLVTPTPESAAAATSQGGRGAGLALVIGGSAIGLAGLIAAGLLFMRSRRS